VIVNESTAYLQKVVDPKIGLGLIRARAATRPTAAASRGSQAGQFVARIRVLL
jgi:hypothetical protein